MGGCSFSGKTSTKSDSVVRSYHNNGQQRNNHNDLSPNNNNNIAMRNLIHNLQNPNSNNLTPSNKAVNKFQDLEEFLDIYSGEGVKKIKAYKSNLLYDQIDKLRDEFYTSKKDKTDYWIAIRQACMTDAATAEMLLSSMNLMCLGDDMRCLVEASSGYIFNVPNFCINYPLVMKEVSDILIGEEQFFKVTLIDVFNNQKHFHLSNISNKLRGQDLKDKFLEKVNKIIGEYNVRLIFKGEEIKNEDILGKFNFDGMNKIQVSCNKKED